MRAIALPGFDSPPALLDLPVPQPAPGEVLVKVRASSVNGFDLAVLAGGMRDFMEHRFPVVLGKDFAGTVEATGEGAVRFAPGDEVFGVVMKPFVGDGAHGDYLSVGDGYGMAAVPEGLGLATAGALGLAGTTALDSLTAAKPEPGTFLLISGATGGVGAIAIQYAAAAGARVIATARPGEEADFVRGLGAEHVVDYSGDVTAQVRAIAPGGVPAVVHLAGDAAALTALLTEGGRIASTLGYALAPHPALVSVVADPQPDTLRRLAEDAAAGRIRVPISRSHPLEEAAQAIAGFAAGTLGKIGITY
ncbi:NADPH:quinone reductase [Acrocarpospora phusangensis]|uniref:NADPH:quinone reductase n=1 Tax=Acrocarpospora phusangensis TaxID=1070424 RepID=A0A919QA27_9ACTN|nr:NADP-dependent oxidoreductase [Acrocarpospora phusangensis]GIH24231.1 NADPH:quinone reductase [Acrocarpospora phusangensis]